MDLPPARIATPSEGIRLLQDSSNRNWLIPLNGWFERNGFSPLLMAVLVLIAGFVGFQIIGAVVAMALVVMQAGGAVLENPMILLEQQTGLLLVGNTVGQFFGLAIPVVLIATLHSRPVAGFLRLRAVDFGLLFGAIAGLILLLPVVQWLSHFNASLPLPDAVQEFERQQIEFLERVLAGETSFVLTFTALAITPAICEELFFRGYIQRQFERAAGVMSAILITGILFGTYHLRFSQIIPLSVLGVYLCYITWRSGSLWPAIVLHLINNGTALVASSVVGDHPEWGVASVDTVIVPLYIVIPSVILLFLLIRTIETRATQELGLEPLIGRSTAVTQTQPTGGTIQN